MLQCGYSRNNLNMSKHLRQEEMLLAEFRLACYRVMELVFGIAPALLVSW